MKMSKLLKMFLLASILIIPATSFAIPIAGTGEWGSYTGDLTYDSGTLRISLTNTSPAANGGYLVGFVFNTPVGIYYNGSYEFSGPSESIFLVTYANNGINGAPYGQFDILAATSDSFTGGGAPQAGLPVGGFATFAFGFSGNTGSVTSEDFLNAYSTTGAASFVVRFRGFENRQSDKVPSSVPEPGTMLLLGIGLLGVGIASRRKS